MLLRKIGLPLFALTVLGTSLDQLLTVKMETMLMSPEGTSNWVWALGALSLLLNLLYPLLGMLLVLSQLGPAQSASVTSEQVVGESAGLADHSPNGFLFLLQNLKLNLIEEMRGWGNAMLWSFLFLVPGFIQFLRFLLIPFVVCFDPQYRSGKVDALKRTVQLSHGQMFRLFGLFFVFAILIPLILSVFDEWKLVWSTPIPALGICLVEMLLNICFILALWKTYQRSLAHELTLPMEGHSIPSTGPHL